MRGGEIREQDFWAPWYFFSLQAVITISAKKRNVCTSRREMAVRHLYFRDSPLTTYVCHGIPDLRRSLWLVSGDSTYIYFFGIGPKVAGTNWVAENRRRKPLKTGKKLEKIIFVSGECMFVRFRFFPEAEGSQGKYLEFPFFSRAHSLMGTAVSRFLRKKSKYWICNFHAPAFRNNCFPRKYLFFFSPQFFLSRSLSKPESSEKGGGEYPSLHRSRKRKGFFLWRNAFSLVRNAQ